MTYPDGMSCEVVIARLELYLASSAPLGEALGIAEHLEACPECHQELLLLRLTMTRRGGLGRRRG